MYYDLVATEVSRRCFCGVSLSVTKRFFALVSFISLVLFVVRTVSYPAWGEDACFPLFLLIVVGLNVIRTRFIDGIEEAFFS